MAGETYLTQLPIVAYSTTSANTQITQEAVVAYLTSTFSTYTTQLGVVAYSVTAFSLWVTQVAVVAWVVDCDSSSYVPPAPTGLEMLTATPGAVDDEWIDLAWSELSGFVYTLMRGTQSGVYTDTLLTDSGDVSYHDDSVLFNTQYYYLMTATNVCGDVTTSNEASAVAGCTLPGRALRLHATANNPAGTIDLIWNASVVAGEMPPS